VNLKGMILAFAGKVLLSSTDLFVERNHRYAVLGNNGVGKTTLLNRISAKDIDGFPMDCKTHYITHEIPADEAECDCEEFLRKALPVAIKGTPKGEAEIQGSLDKVGFGMDETTGVAMRTKMIAELSGGWRMKLTVARSMLNPVDLLLLDEPTNHLDVEAVKWLTSYLAVELKDVTMMVVSHDYDFLEDVVTDVLHICNLKLTNYDVGFKAFQKLRPEIVAGEWAPSVASGLLV
jgi:elongation factor 3